jgi:hypothetical protein
VTDQVIGRAIRICSHATLPLNNEQYVFPFMSVPFQKKMLLLQLNPPMLFQFVEQIRSYVNMKEKRNKKEVFMSTDEYLYEKAYEKDIHEQAYFIIIETSGRGL